MRVWSSVAGGVNIFCCTRNKTIVKIGRMFRYGPNQPVSLPRNAGRAFPQ